MAQNRVSRRTATLFIIAASAVLALLTFFATFMVGILPLIPGLVMGGIYAACIMAVPREYRVWICAVAILLLASMYAAVMIVPTLRDADAAWILWTQVPGILVSGVPSFLALAWAERTKRRPAAAH